MLFFFYEREREEEEEEGEGKREIREGKKESGINKVHDGGKRYCSSLTRQLSMSVVVLCLSLEGEFRIPS